jgi:phthalate 4,5-dioxygenase oxygenase subunit
MPEFERPAFAPTENTQVSIVKILVDCNWAQVLEGQIDSAHSSSLHSSDMRPAKVNRAEAAATHWLRPSTDKSPRLQVERTDYGFHYAAIRRPITNAATHDYVRKTVYIAPFVCLIPPNNAYNVTSVIVPQDDTHTAFHFLAWREEDNIDQEAWRKFNVAQPGIDLDEDYRNRRTRANDYLQDRNAMKLGDFTGIRGIPNQDIAMWESMGPIADRTRERLVASDRGIALLRKLLFEQLERVAQGLDPLGVVRDPVENRIIELPQESEKYRDGAGFLAEALELSHVRYSPLRAEIARLVQGAPRPAPERP